MPTDDIDEGGFDADADILPDSLVDKHLNPAPAADDSDTGDDDPEDTLDDEGLDIVGAEEDEDEAGDEELEEVSAELDADDEDEEDDEEEEGDEDEGSDEAEDEDEVLERVTAEERRAIEKDPKLRKLHKLMQRDYTKKTTEARNRERAAEQLEQRTRSFEAAIQTPQGMVEFLAKNMRNHMDVVGAAFEAVATGDVGHDFLVEVGLHKPEVFTKAAERVQELLDDETERNAHVRRRDTKAAESRLQRERRLLAQDRFDTQHRELIGEAVRVAKKLGIHKDDLEDVRAEVTRRIEGATQRDGNIALDKAAVRATVKDAKKAIDVRLARVSKRLGRTTPADRQAAVKKKAARAQQRRVVPKAGKQAAATKRVATRAKVPEGVDPLDFYVDRRLGINRR